MFTNVFFSQSENLSERFHDCGESRGIFVCTMLLFFERESQIKISCNIMLVFSGISLFMRVCNGYV